MKATLLTTSFFLLALSAWCQPVPAVPSMYEPAISPDGKEIVFVSGGDLWTVSSDGGEARLLAAHPAMESRPVYAPNGRYIAFNSSRTGNGDIYLLDLHTNAVRRITYSDAAEEVTGWSPDSKYIYFSTTAADIAGMRDVFRIRARGGTPMPVSDTRYVTEYMAVPAPQGGLTALVARGMGAVQWWRNGHSHLDESEIWLLDESQNSYQKLAAKGAKQLWPMWSADAGTLYYMSDKSGAENIWQHPIGGKARQLTMFRDGRVSFPSISADGSTIVFERDFSIWKLNLHNGQAGPLAISLKGTASTTAPEVLKLYSGFSDLAIAPDGKKLAFIAQGELFVTGTRDAGEAVRISNTAGPESSPVWTKNSKKLYYISGKSGNNYICQYNFKTEQETRLTSGNADEGSMVLSPDGRQLAFVRNGRHLVILNLNDQTEYVAASAAISFSPVRSEGAISWSPDSRWIAFAAHGSKSFRNVYLVSSKGGEARPVSFLANTFGGEIVWGKDGKYLLYLTSQRTEQGQVARIDLQARQPVFAEDQFQELFSEADDTSSTAASKAKKAEQPESTDPLFEGIRNRLSQLSLGVDVSEVAISNDRKTLLVRAGSAGQTNLFTYSLDETAKEPAVLKQLTYTAGYKTNMQFGSDDKEVYYLEAGKIYSVALDTRQPKALNVQASVRVDFNERKMEIFRQTWDLQYKGFYDEGYHGVDWKAMRELYAPYAAGAATPDELRRILNLMVGELNASHSGVSDPSGQVTATGQLGLRFDASLYEQEGLLKITEVITAGPAALAGNIHAGDYLWAIDGVELHKKINMDSLLEHKINKRVALTLSKDAEGLQSLRRMVKPVSLQQERSLLYQQWVQQNREAVARWSGGRLGYVHMMDMSQLSLDRLHLDMDAQNHSCEAVVVDIRNNNGGFVNAYALDVLSRKGYMTMTVRGLPATPARLQLGQRALDAPTILLTNQHSLSDAEDFSEGYRALGLGKIVGEPTSGWIIYTSNVTLFDGTVVRLPFIKITDSKGQNMELAPRPVDIAVSNELGEDKDRQLERAVKELMRQLASQR